VTTLYLDLETYCETPIKDGTHRYAESVEVMIAAWALDDGPLTVEDITAPGDGQCPVRLRPYLLDPDVPIVFHNSVFDRTMIRHAWGIDILTERIHDTMVQALAHGLPGSLDKLGDIYKLPEHLAKDKDGGALIQLFCKPLPKNSKLRRATRETHPAKWQQFLNYAGSDIRAMRALKKLMPTWNLTERERALWRLDQKINDRGFAVDLDLARSAIAAVNAEQARMKKRTVELTGGEPSSTTQRDALLAHILKEYGVSLPDMAKDTIERRLADETLPEALRELLRIRLSQTTSSTAKYAAALRSVSKDGRLKGTLQFCGAQRTGRWAGRLFQPQNMMRPDMKNADIDLAIEAIKSGAHDLVLDDLMRCAANAMRGMLVAPSGKKIVSSDLKNIEGRVAAWLAGEQWKLDAFAAYDAGEGPDLYAMAYAKSFSVTPDSVMEDYKAGGSQRQVGKVQELALAYEGGVGAFLAFAEVYRLDLEDMGRRAFDSLPSDARKAAEEMLAWRKRKGITTFGLSDRAYAVCQAFVSMWREAHPQTSGYWGELDKTARLAINNRGVDFPCRKVVFRRDGTWLRMILPSGRSLCYPSPRIEHGKVTYLGVNSYTKQWGRLGTYGGKWFENQCQGLARDVMAWNMPAIEDEGFEIITTIHDDVPCEAPAGSNWLTTDTLSALLATNPPWLPGCPLAASGFEAVRYAKN
jgi:DNA polymerase